MKGFLMMILVIPGLVLLATPALPLGVGLILLGVWVFERSGMRDSDALINVALFLGGLGALLPVYEAVRNWIRY